MGLRTTSVNNANLSDKQRDMLNARHPESGNQQNQQLQETKEINRQRDEQRKGIATQQQAQKQGVIAQIPQAAQAQPMPASTQRNLSSLSNRYAAKVNQILAGGDVSQLATKQLEPVFVPGKGWEVPDPTSSNAGIFDVDPLAQQKYQEIQQLRGEMDPYFQFTDTGDKTTVNAKDFGSVLEQFADQNGDGIISPDEQQFLNEAVDIAAMLERLRDVDPESPEAKALEMQLAILDETGLVSGIQRAYDQYQRIVGEGKGGIFYGSEGQTVDVESLVNMSMDDIKDNLMYVLTGEQPSIFGGDFKQALASTQLATKAQKAQQLDTETRNAVMRATADWATDTSDQFQQFNDEIDQGFSNAYDSANQRFQEMLNGAETEEDKMRIEAAWQWFDDLFTGEGADNPAKVMEELLSSDSGLAFSQRMTLAKWLGAATGIDPAKFQGGLIKEILDDVANQGYAEIDIRDENGNPQLVKFELDDRDRLEVARILRSKIPNDEKQSRIGDIVDRNIRKRFDASGDLKAIEGYFKNGQFNAGLDAFVDSVVGSLNTFNKSLTQGLYQEIVGTGAFSEMANAPEGANPADYIDVNKVNDIWGLAYKKAEDAYKAMSDMSVKLTDTVERGKVNAEEDIQKLTDMRNAMFEASTQGVRSIMSQLNDVIVTNKFPEYSEAFDTAVSQLLGGLSKQTYDEPEFIKELVNPGAAKPLYATVKNPRYNPEVKAAIEARNANIDFTYDSTSANAVAAKEAYTIASNLKYMLESNKDNVLGKAILRANPTARDLINNPQKILKKFFSVSGGSQNVTEYLNALNKEVANIAKSAAPAMYYESSIGKGVTEANKQIARDIENARNYLSNYDRIIEKVRAITDRTKEAMTPVYSPEQIAQAALEEARLFESGQKTGTPDFIKMLPGSISKDELEAEIADIYGSGMYVPATAAMPEFGNNLIVPEVSGSGALVDLGKYGRSPAEEVEQPPPSGSVPGRIPRQPPLVRI